jgi:peptidoglycan/xylan/chitin deacetylase (PgdA/CDA1 family)
MYHDVLRADRGRSGFGGAGPGRYAVAWERFVAHLDAIERAVGTAPALLDPASSRDRVTGWLLTFDDGGVSFLDTGEELARRGWRGHFFVTASLVGTAGFLDADGVRELDRMGHVVGSHSVTHPDRMGALSFPEILREWRKSCELLAEILGEPPRVASVPGGYYRKRVGVAAAQVGITALFNSEPVRDVRSVDGCFVIGRFGIRSDTPAAEAAAAAAGDRATWRRQYVAWNVRKPAKAVGGAAYDRVRRVLLARRSGG